MINNIKFIIGICQWEMDCSISNLAGSSFHPPVCTHAKTYTGISTPQTEGLPNSEVLDNHLERTSHQAHAGADIVIWDEGGVCVTQENESLFIDGGCELARREDIYLLMGLCVVNVEDEHGDAIQKVVWINPSGEVENGFSLVRATCEGLSAAFDYHGGILNSADFFTSDAAPMVSYVPTQGVRTVYSVLGDFFAWLCAVGFV